MPRKQRPGTTPVLVQIDDPVHAAADKRRRAEGITWTKVISTLLARWSAEADDTALTNAVKARPATPEAAEMDRWHEHQMATNESYRRAATEKVDPTKLKWHRSLGELLAAGAAHEDRPVLAEALTALDMDQGEVDP